MKTQIIALESHDDLISVRDRMSWAKAPRILLVWPRYEAIALRPADLRILQQHAQYLGADLGLVTRRGAIRRDAERFGIPVFPSAAAAQREAWAARHSAAEPVARPERKSRAELQAMKEMAAVQEAGWRSRPAARVGFFLLGVVAVLIIASLFLPEATIRLTPVTQTQSVALSVNASKSVSAVSIAGNIPAHEITVTVGGTQSARVTSQSPIPGDKATGIVRFTNMTPSGVAIPAGTIVYSVSPNSVQFATLHDTHIPGNINAVVEVPIAALAGGSDGNLPANAIQAIAGSLSLAATVTNPEPTTGGSDRITIAPSKADRQRVHDVLMDILQKQALQQIRAGIGARDLLLTDTLKMGEALDESYSPPEGQPGDLIQVSIRAEFSAAYVKADDLKALAAATLDLSIPQGFLPEADSLSFRTSAAPTANSSEGWTFQVQADRTLTHELNPAQANAMVRGLPPLAAIDALRASLPLAQPPVIQLKPGWWPWMPLVPFRITVISNQ